MSEADAVGPDAVETKRQRAMESLRWAENRYRLAAEAGKVAVWRMDLASGRFETDGTLERIIGYAPGEIGVEPAAWQQVTHPDDLERTTRLWQQASEGVADRYDCEYRLLHKDGSVRWVDVRGAGQKDDTGRVVGLTGTTLDITERKRAERTQQTSEERYRAVVEDQTEVISRFRADGTILFANDVLCRFFGKTSEELIGKKWQPRAVAEDVPLIEAHLQQLTPAHPVVTIENRVYAASGEARWMQFVNRAFFDPQGRLAEIQAVGRDITERKRLEADLRGKEAERAEAVARLVLVEEQERQRLSRELHDQTAQRLVALAVELKTLETNLAAGRPQAERVRALRKAVDDIQQQVRQLAWDLRAGEVIQGGLEHALRAYVEEWSERAAVPADCECRGLDGPPLSAPVEATLYRVAQEALANVEKHAQAGRVSVLLERDETLVRLTVEDDGRGFAVDAAQNSPDSAPHLGLLGMHERVTLVGGTLLIESSPGSGTTILVRIPLPTEAKSS